MLPAIVAALFLCGCAGFTPARDAAAGPYRVPDDGDETVYEGFVNEHQMRHLRSATFPELNETERALIREINRDVNEDIRYLPDEDNYGLLDFAMAEPRVHRPAIRGLPAGRYGDCEDYALTKKKRLAESGIHPSRLFVARAEVPTGDGTKRHVVLAVPEGSEWWILNNWDNRIEPASYLARWWDWEFIRPRFDEYQQVVRWRNGAVRTAAAGLPKRG